MLDINSCTVLNNGVKMPWLGFGTYKIEYKDTSTQYIKMALEAGYRHIDTAAVYGNEPIVGKALNEYGIPRDKVFITSKVWNNKHGYDKTLKAFQDTLRRLDTDYLDLYLIHWPKKLNKDTWRAMEKLYKDGYIRAIGVSNFKIHHLEEIMEDSEIVPMVNQVEYHPEFPQTELHDFCKKNNIQLEAWGPLMQGKIFEIPLMKSLSEKYGKTISQIALRWDLQMNVVTIPKSINENRIKENSNIYDFEISKEDMKKIESLNTGERIGHDPDTITF
ncbi:MULTISPECIES: aldo/keto reductase [Clostridium]|uniref:aldo/keto reductase n=1 Tax=Clostridium TaxID=1485 RepID=UPI0008252603|nr:MULTISPECIES: aldo/keto reductase [Clostridium]PJI10116.1 aldo/keto reductase [Clostridium sp. CT7]